MADSPAPGTRALLLAGGGLVVLVLLSLARGPVALLAAASVAVLVGIVLAVPPLLRHDGIDWDWLPDRAVDVPPEPGIANLRRLLAPTAGDTAGPGAAAAAGAGHRRRPRRRRRATDAGAWPPTSTDRRASLDLAEADAVITELEALPIQET